MRMESYDVQLQCILTNGLHHVYCNVIAGILCRRDVTGEKGAATELKLADTPTCVCRVSATQCTY